MPGPWVHEVVPLARTADEQADVELLTLLLDEKSASGWEHYLTSGDLHFFRRPSVGDEVMAAAAPTAEPAAGVIACGDCEGWQRTGEALGRCRVSALYTQPGSPCDYKFTSRDQWKASEAAQADE